MTPITTQSHPVLTGPLERYLVESVQPVANQLDGDSTALFDSFERLGAQGWLAPKLPESSGGLGLTGAQYQQFQSLIAQYSGALAFLQTQHQSAASLLGGSDNEAMKRAYLPGMAAGAKRVGVGFSQLRRSPAPLRAVAVKEGYRLSGEVPWVTGAGLFTDFVGAAVLSDKEVAGEAAGTAVFVLLPLVSRVAEGGRLRVDEPMRLAGMAGTNTVRVQLEDWWVRPEGVVGMRPAGWIEERDRANPLSPLGLIFGCAQAGIGVLVRSLQRRQIEGAIATPLKRKLASMQADLPTMMALPTDAYAQKMAFRAQAIALMNTCAQAAVIATSGAANSVDHPAQRIYKESLVFSVSGQTTEGAIETLNAVLSSL